jgi:Asp-tRNA(Asn)/Glu-tRNA(Gln) amidotransferase A subunit family amidase
LNRPETLRARLLAGEIELRESAEQALANANRNAGRNVYLSLDKNWTLREADRVQNEFFNRDSSDEKSRNKKPPLFGLPISLKDCFDLENFRTTVGTRYYAERNEIAREDSAVSKRLRAQGAVVVGKTNLHPLAYGITGENPDFGDCLQPADANLLTGGSTSGGAASVQEGSAVAAIGTDTGGSIRVPAALCGLAGYRASIGLAWQRDLWRGGVHLAQSFDTLGWIFRDLRDAPLLAQGLFGLEIPVLKIPGQTGPQAPRGTTARIGAIAPEFLHDCDGNVLAAFASCKELLAAGGADVQSFDAAYWEHALSIYAPIQAGEAAAIHAVAIKTGAIRTAKGDGNYSCFPAPRDCENFSQFPKIIAERLAWGASLSAEEVQRQRARHAEFRDRVDALFQSFDFLMLPCSPISKLEAGKDHTQTRPKILRYTTPLSLAGTPVVTVPFPDGAGMQLAAPRGQDAKLLACAVAISGQSPATRDQ